MSFLSVLKDIGNAVNTANQIVNGYGPIAAQLIPGTKDDKIIAIAQTTLDDAANVVVNAEAFGQALSLPGTAKATAAAGPMYQLMLQMKLVAGKKPKDEAAARAAAQRMGQDLADFLNAFEG
jgi:hypothetical protein